MINPESYVISHVLFISSMVTIPWSYHFSWYSTYSSYFDDQVSNFVDLEKLVPVVILEKLC